jgi:multidrug efflux pump subunit AcrA (membrane-fusion protein)
MADLRTLEVEVDVNEAYIARITNGQAARITLDAYPDTSFAASVRQVVPTADRQKATVLVKVAIDDKDPRILPEMGARGGFVPEGQSAAQAATPRRIYVPAAAIAEGKVWLVEQGKAKSQSVTPGVAGWRPRRGEGRPDRRGDRDRLAAEGLKDGATVRVKSG